jgi:PAS domain S-box-containing protein
MPSGTEGRTLARQRFAGGRNFGERELRRLVDRVPDVVFRYRTQPPGYDFVSRAITRLTGLTPGDLYADPAYVLKLVHHDDRAIVHEFIARGTGRVPIIVRWLRTDGSVVWVEQRSIPVLSRSRVLVAIEGVAREIADPTVGAPAHIRVLGGLRIDLERARVLADGNDVHLTPSELRLLLLLTDQPGRTVGRATIMEALWNSSHVGNGRTCEVHIAKLRRKLESSAGSPSRYHIETVRGKGYRFTLSG